MIQSASRAAARDRLAHNRCAQCGQTLPGLDHTSCGQVRGAVAAPPRCAGPHPACFRKNPLNTRTAQAPTGPALPPQLRKLATEKSVRCIPNHKQVRRQRVRNSEHQEPDSQKTRLLWCSAQLLHTICAAQLLHAAQPVTINRNHRSRSPEYADTAKSTVKVSVCHDTG